MRDWTDDQIWEAVDAWRWIPPGSKRAVHESFELAVTPGSYALTYAYRTPREGRPFRRSRRDGVGETGGCSGRYRVRVHVQPDSHPKDLAERLTKRGYKVAEEAEALVWELFDKNGRPRLPDFRPAEGVTVREAVTEGDYDGFLILSTPIFGDPVPTPVSRIAFKREFERIVRETGHSDRLVAWEGATPIGRPGLEIVGGVARLWGTGVLPQHRKRGAYGLLVRARCEEALRRGATLALTTARVGTSGPILKHHGFRAVGSVRILEARW